MKTFIKKLVHYHPDGVIDNAKFEHFLDTTAAWISEKTGIIERRFMEDYQGPFPGLEISRRALAKIVADPNFDRSKIGMIISASTHDDVHYPNAGNIIAEELNLEVPVMQLKTACTSVAYAIFVAKAVMATSSIKDILIINGEPFTRYVDYGDRSSSILFGDASSAMILSSSQGDFEVIDVDIGGKGLQIVQATRVSATSHLTVEDLVTGELVHGKPEFNRRVNSDKKFQQDGKKVVAFVLEEMPSKIGALLARNQIALDELTFVISHQSNLVMMKQLWEQLRVPENKHLYNVDRFGNTSSSGWITVLSQKQDSIPHGSLVLASIFGAGMTWANVLLRKT